MKIAIIGATGLVGKKTMECLEPCSLDIDEIIPVASIRSEGKELIFRNRVIKVKSIEECLSLNPRIAFFAVGSELSLEWAPIFAAQGCYVIDKSSAWRMTEGIPLVIPEINSEALSIDTHIIASPNCSTSQLVLALHPLNQKYGLKRVLISTYQSISGSGSRAIEQYEAEQKGSIDVNRFYSKRIMGNCIPHCDDFLEDGFTKEERKLVDETKKILKDTKILISATSVRVPVLVGHSESIHIELKQDFEIQELRACLSQMEGVCVEDDPDNLIYPTPYEKEGDIRVFIGRIRRDTTAKNSLWMWVVSDNLLKGAAANAVQIAELLQKKGYL